MHRGVEATCMPGAYLAYLANAVAFLTAALLLCSFALDTRARRPRAYELAATSDVGCPPAPDGDDAPKARLSPRYEPSPRAGGAPPAPDADDGVRYDTIVGCTATLSLLLFSKSRNRFMIRMGGRRRRCTRGRRGGGWCGSRAPDVDSVAI